MSSVINFNKDLELKIKYLKNYKMSIWGPMKYAREGDACFDARAAIDKPIILKRPYLPFLSVFTKINRYMIPLGFKVELPKNYELQIRIRSNIAKNFGVSMSNGIGTIDYGYRNQVFALLSNFGNKNLIIKPGMKIVQCKIAYVPEFKLVSVKKLSNTKRGKGGFGSTGLY